MSRIPVVNYSKEVMELHLAKLSERDIDLISYNLAKVIYGSREDVDITMADGTLKCLVKEKRRKNDGK